MQVVVAAGGAGTRLRSVTGALPKVLAPVCGEPFLARVTDRLIERGASSIHLLLGVGADAVLDWVQTAQIRIPVTWSIETQPLGVIGGLRYAAAHLAPRFILIYGDVYPIESEPLSEFLDTAGRVILGVIGGTSNEPPNLTLDGDLVTGYGRSPSARALDAGMIAMHRHDVVELVPPDEPHHESEFYSQLIARGLRLRVQDQPTVHIGDPDAYQRACRHLNGTE